MIIFKRIVIFLALIISLDFIFGSFFEYIFYNQKSGNYYRTNEGIFHNNSEIFVFGSSIANHHIVPEVINDSLDLSVYNLGKDGMDIVYHYHAFRLLTERLKPKYVILCLTPKELSSQESHDRIAEIHPYLKHLEGGGDYSLFTDSYITLKLFSKLYPYNSKVTTLIKGYFSTEKVQNTNGYVPLFDGKRKMPLNTTISYSNDTTVDFIRTQAFNKFIKLSDEKGVKLIILISPYYNFDSTVTNSIKIMSKTCELNDLLFLNFLNDTAFVGKDKFFFDEGHLNNQGAIKLTSIVASELKKNCKSD